MNYQSHIWLERSSMECRKKQNQSNPSDQSEQGLRYH